MHIDGRDVYFTAYVLLIGIATAAVSRQPRSAPSVVTAILLVAFIISSAINMNSNLELVQDSQNEHLV